MAVEVSQNFGRTRNSLRVGLPRLPHPPKKLEEISSADILPLIEAKYGVVIENATASASTEQFMSYLLSIFGIGRSTSTHDNRLIAGMTKEMCL